MSKKPKYIADGLITDNYQTSKDYALLKRLLDANISVVCFVDYDPSPQTRYVFQNVCKARRVHQCYEFCARSISYGTWYADFNFTFEQLCESLGVEFIVPNKNVKSN